MSPIAKNNAFGPGCPGWNLDFPDGNLTVSEILAYCPHWLKSVDVVGRFVTHGGRSVIITHLINKYRTMPKKVYLPNSTTVMMNYAMRRIGHDNWTLGRYGKFENDREYDEDSVYVGDFRTPRLTHPKKASSKTKMEMEKFQRNWPADPVPFKDLAVHVKEHPSGDDALDLTRCVKYALKHPDETWLFPGDFPRLVEHIGGPATVTNSHCDKQLFLRYDHLYSAHKAVRAPVQPKVKTEAEVNVQVKGKKAKREYDDTESEASFTIAKDYDGDSEGDTDIGRAARAKSKPNTKRRKTAAQASSKNQSETFTQDPFQAFLNGAYQAFTNKSFQVTDNSFLPSFYSAMAAESAASVDNHALDQVDGSYDVGDGKRRSSRRVNKAPVYTENDDDAMDIEAFGGDYVTPRKTRTLSRLPSARNDEESEFEAKDDPETEDDFALVQNETADDFDFGTPTAARGRRIASHKARKNISEQASAAFMQQPSTNFMQPSSANFMQQPHAGFMQQSSANFMQEPFANFMQEPFANFMQQPSAALMEQSSEALMEQFNISMANARLAHPTSLHDDPAMAHLALAYDNRQVHRLPPPVLPADRTVIDPFTVYIYAQEGCRNDDELWASALSFYRFGGPRRTAPFRELYRLTNPELWDTSDWAENVRWAKEQYLYYGVETWTEHDDHIQQINSWRWQSHWVSEAILMHGHNTQTQRN